ncbi:MAG: hypothetical protein H0U23_00655 [Blastocatellia bacterium]|nr:hypothetical protein [Blastocatellia bacterium]
MNSRRFSLLLAFVLACPAASILHAAPTQPGTYQKWKGEIDEVVVRIPFRADDFQDIQVEPFDLTRVAVPERQGESGPAVAAGLPALKPAFMEGLQSNLRRRTPASGAPARALVVRIHVVKADPGTRFPAFGDLKANAAKLAVTGELVDPTTNRTLIVFKQERWSGVVTIGKNSSQLLADAARLIGHDVAELISAF